MDKIKISICMPTRNRAGFIGQALESIISQADDRVEVVIVDGASQDNTRDVVGEYQKRFKNLVYCRQEKNGGVDRDMAKAITLARGEYCWLFSDDDLLKPGAIKRMLKEIEAGYEIYLCNITACNLFMRPYKEMSWLSRGIGDRVFNLHDKNEFREYCDKANSVGAFFSYWSAIVLRRQVWVESGYAYDFDNSAYALAATLFSSFGRRCRLKYLKDSLVSWRNDNESFQHEGGLVKRFLLDFDAYLHLADKYLSFDPQVKASFLKVMPREHPWYTIIHAVSFIDDPKLWLEFKAKLLKFGYSKKMAEICYALGKYKKLISLGVKIKRLIARSRMLNKIAGFCAYGSGKSQEQIFIALFNYLLVFNIFAGAFTIFRQPFEFYLGYIFIIFFLAIYIYRFRSARINFNFIILLAILTITSLINVYLGNDTVFLLAKQVLGILITGVAYYLLLKINNYDIDKLFKIYLRIALIVACIGIFQELSFLAGFKMGYDYKWMWMMTKWECGRAEGGLYRILRVNSIFMEPAHFAVSMAPAFFVSFFDIIKKNAHSLKSKWASIAIIVSYLLTISALAYLTVIISILLFARGKKITFLLIAAIAIPAILFGAYSFLPDIHMRINDAFAFLWNPRVNLDTHMSVYSLVSNTFVAFKSFIINPLFGLGLGSHPLSYDKFMSLGVAQGFMQYNYPEVCKGDSGSLFLRLFSEAGLFGMSVVLYFIFRFRLKMKNQSNLFIISNAVFILFILQLLRQAHYFYNGLFFFVWVYYFAYKISHSKI